MGSYRIEWRKSAVKDLRKIPVSDLERITSGVESLGSEPRPAGSVKLSGSERSYRVRIGDYRVLYDVFDDRVLIEIVKVGHRKDVYR